MPTTYTPKAVHSGDAVANLYHDGEITCGACQITIGFTFDKPFFADGISAANRRHDDAAAAASDHYPHCVAR